MALSKVGRAALAARLSNFAPCWEYCRVCLATKATKKKTEPDHFPPDPRIATPKEETKFGSEQRSDAPPENEPNVESEEERLKRQERLAKNVKYSGYSLVAASAGAVAYALMSYGPPQIDENGQVVVDEFSHCPFSCFCVPTIRQYFLRTWREIKFWKTWIAEPSRSKLLPDPLPEPYIQPKYTLVIELKHILVHPEWTVGYPHFEVVIYTEETGLTAHPIVDGLDPEQKIMYRLYRDTTKFDGRHHVKDLDKLNRPLQKVIHIDWDPMACSARPENALLLPQWDGGDNDTDLVDLANMLKAIAAADEDDVRPVLAFYNQFDNPAKEFRQRSHQLKSSGSSPGSDSDKESGFVGKYAGRLFGFRRHATS